MNVRDIYADYFNRPAGRPPTPIKILAAERLRIVGTPSGMDEVPDDARGSLLMLTSGFYPGPEAAHRGTTLGELSQFTVYGRPPPCASFPDSAAASVTIGELGDYSDPATGLEHHLAVGRLHVGCREGSHAQGRASRPGQDRKPGARGAESSF